MTDKAKLNGSVNMLADAMRRVFTEAVEGAVEPLREDLKSAQSTGDALLSEMAHMEKRLADRIDKRASTTDENVQAQIANMETRMQERLG